MPGHKLIVPIPTRTARSNVCAFSYPSIPERLYRYLDQSPELLPLGCFWVGLIMPANSDKKQLGLFEGLAPNPKPTADTSSKPIALCTRCTEQYLSDHQVAARFNITKATVWRWHDPRRIKLSPGTSRWKLSDLVLFEAKMQEACTSSNLAKANGRP